MNNKGQDVSLWTETWDNINIERSVQMWDYFGIRPWILKYTPRDGNVLEAGCGLGRYNFYLHHFGINIEGLDFSQKTIDFLNHWKKENNYKELSFVTGDITNLPYDSNSLSGYLSFGVVEHFIAGPEVPLKEAYRALRPGGVAIITTPNHTWSKKYNRTKVFIKKALNVLRGKKFKKKEFFQYEYSPKQLKKHVEKAGFKTTEYTGADFLFTITQFGLREENPTQKLPWYYKLSKRIDNSRLRNLGAQSITISIKTADNMYCFLCGAFNVGLESLNDYTVPICENCKETNNSNYYQKKNRTYYHEDYQINPPIKKPTEKECEYCNNRYQTHWLFEDFGLTKNICYDCLKQKPINIELSNNSVKPIWRH